MKKLLITFLIVGLFSNICYSQCKYRFIINDKSYFIEETALNDLFGRAFVDLKQTGNADERKFDTWLESFDIYKSLACQGTYEWKIYYNRVADAKYSGQASDAQLGIYKGKRKNPNKPENIAYRMALLNSLMQKYLTKHFINVDVE